MPITSKQMIKKLSGIGFVVISQNGSHVKLKNPKTGVTLIIPMHNKDLKKGLEQKINKIVGFKNEGK